MKTYDHAGPDPDTVRAHPWSGAAGDPAARYHDFKARPALIRTSLEDFLPWAEWPAIGTFYDLLTWLNGSESSLESNDCAFQGIGANSNADFSKALEVSGRLMVLWRAIPLNLARSNVEWLRWRIHRLLNEMDPEFAYGAVGMTIWRVRFVTLPVPEGRNVGFQLMLSFWAWGDTDEEVMANLARTVQNLWEALRGVVGEARVHLGGQEAGA